MHQRGSPDGAQRNPGIVNADRAVPDFAALHPGYAIAPRHPVIPGRAKREPGIHTRRCLL
jgi:hypothetical protein